MKFMAHFPKYLMCSFVAAMAAAAIAAMAGMALIPGVVLADDSAIKTDEVLYGDDAAPLSGYLAVPADLKEGEKRPGILLIHDWTGLQEYAKQRTRQLAELGFIAFAADVYGKGVRPVDPQECGVQAGIYKSDRTLFRKRMNATLEVLKSHKQCDSQKLAAIGYCFGGTGVIELALSGADLDAFVKEMDDAGVDLQMISYSGAVHSFTKPDAGDDNSKGAAYNENADKRSLEHMRTCFKEVLGC